MPSERAKGELHVSKYYYYGIIFYVSLVIDGIFYFLDDFWDNK
jgi:hypothetical protein